jgi:uncharacterized protein
MTHDVRHAPGRSRYELFVDGELVGVADYRLSRDGVATFPHTEIDGQRRGRGLGAVLVRAALDAERAAGHTIVPSCWYVAEFIDDNPEYADLVAM